MTQKKGTVEKERVVCQNCRYHYSFLYEAKESLPDSRPTMTGNLQNYVHPRESFRPCSNCGFVQDWMVGARRRQKLIDLILVSLIGGCGVLLYLIYQMVVVAMNPLQAAGFAPLNQAQLVAGLYVGLVALAACGYYSFLRWGWNPNKDVDTDSYEAATPEEVCPEDLVRSVSEYEAASRLMKEEQLPSKKKSSPWASLTLTKKIFILLGFSLGLAALSAPWMSSSLAVSLAKRGMSLLPFYLGLALFVASLVGGSWNLFDQRLK
jgi:hypothetical protein